MGAIKAMVETGEKTLGKGKGVTISRTGQKLGKRSADLQEEIRKLEAKDELTRAENAELSEMKRELKDIRKEMAAEPERASNKAQETARSNKMKDQVTLPEAPFDIPKKRKGGVIKKATPFNKGGMPSRKGNFDMRKGGMFMK